MLKVRKESQNAGKCWAVGELCGLWENSPFEERLSQCSNPLEEEQEESRQNLVSVLFRQRAWGTHLAEGGGNVSG